MTFLEVQRMLTQTRKARNGVNNRKDYFENDPNEDFYELAYHKALTAANKVVKYYFEKGIIDKRDKIKVEIKAHED